MGKVESTTTTTTTTTITSTTTNHTVIIDPKGGPTQSCMGIGCTLKCDNRGSITNGEQNHPIASVKCKFNARFKAGVVLLPSAC